MTGGTKTLGLLLLASFASGAEKPTLSVRAFPTIQVLDFGRGCSPVHLTAELKGPEVEEFYCPKVVWEKPDTTRSVSESDCPPFEARHECYPPLGPDCGEGWRRLPDGRVITKKPCECHITGYPRRWTFDLCAPEHPTGGAWEVNVYLMKQNKLLRRDSVRFYVK